MKKCYPLEMVNKVANTYIPTLSKTSNLHSVRKENTDFFIQKN